jgi:hypothetical protein
MKTKAVVFVLVIFFTLAATVGAQWLAESSGKKSASGIITTGAAYLSAVQVLTDGSNDATVIIYDNTSAAGTILFQGTVAGADSYGGRVWPWPVAARTGLYVAISGTGAGCFVEYIKR